VEILTLLVGYSNLCHTSQQLACTCATCDQRINFLTTKLNNITKNHLYQKSGFS